MTVMQPTVLVRTHGDYRKWANDKKTSALSSRVVEFEVDTHTQHTQHTHNTHNTHNTHTTQEFEESDIILPRKNKKVNESMDKYKPTDAEHQQIMEAWRNTYVPYRKLLERYETYVNSIAK